MKRIDLTPDLYHQQRFNPKLLPDVAAAGPISSSVLHDSRNPLKFMTTGPKDQTEAMKWGSMVDCLWLTPEDWQKHFITLPPNPPRRPSPAQIKAYEKGTAKQASVEAIEFWRTWDSRANGKTIVDESTLQNVRIARNMLDRHPIAHNIWQSSEKQVVYMGEIPGLRRFEGGTGKCMLDLLPQEGTIEVDGTTINLRDSIVDLKQCHDVSERGMEKAVAKFEYHMRLNWYSRLVAETEDHFRQHKILIFQNSNPPHDVHVRLLIKDSNIMGQALVQERLDQLSKLDPEALHELYDTTVTKLSLPKWYEPGEE